MMAAVNSVLVGCRAPRVQCTPMGVHRTGPRGEPNEIKTLTHTLFNYAVLQVLPAG